MKRIRDIFALAMLALVVSSCSREESTALPGEAKKLPDQEIWDFKATTTTNGKVEAVIRAGHMQRYSKESRMLFDDGIHVDFYDERGEHASELIAASGEYDVETENVKAVGNVIVVSDSGITLYTDELFYYHESDRIISNKLVKVETREGHVLHGIGFESDAQMDFWEIRQPYDGSAPGVDLSLDRFEKKARPDSALADSTELALPADPDAAIDTLVNEQ